MQVIRNKNNFIKDVAKLQQQKHRDVHGVFVVEGLRGVQDTIRHYCDLDDNFQKKSIEVSKSNNIVEASKSNAQNSTNNLIKKQDIVYICINESFYKENTEFVDRVQNINIELYVIADIVFAGMCETQNSQGILAVVRMFKVGIDDVDVGALSAIHHHCLYLDRIRDPGNMGTILRTAVAAGFNLVFLDNCVDVYSPKVVRSAVSALSHLKLVYINHTDNKDNKDNKDNISSNTNPLDIIKSHYKLIGTSPIGENMYTAILSDKNKCLVIGNEANGISDEILKACDIVLSLPMHSMESLNASVAAGVVMYHMEWGRK